MVNIFEARFGILMKNQVRGDILNEIGAIWTHCVTILAFRAQALFLEIMGIENLGQDVGGIRQGANARRSCSNSMRTMTRRRTGAAIRSCLGLCVSLPRLPRCCWEMRAGH